MNNQHFWNQDIRVLARIWFDNVWTLGQAFFVFALFSLPVVIPGLIMWWVQIVTGRP